MATKYRIRVRLRDNWKIQLKRYRTSDCRKCVIAAALAIRDQVALAHKVDVSAVHWWVDWLPGSLSDWQVCASHELTYGREIFDHGHGRSGTGKLRATDGSGGVVSESGTASVSLRWRSSG